jgi:hypothetical protein
LALPTITAPAARSRVTTGASASGTWSAKKAEPMVVVQPAVSMLSFRLTVRPARAGRRSRAWRRATSPASSRARGLTEIRLRSAGSSASIKASCSRVRATGSVGPSGSAAAGPATQAAADDGTGVGSEVMRVTPLMPR